MHFIQIMHRFFIEIYSFQIHFKHVNDISK